MNYLGHAFTSGTTNPPLLAGNMMGDYIKGRRALEALPPDIQEGVLLHRRIDAFTDAHPATLRAALPFRETYGRYAPAIVDTLYDHFLANDPACFASEAALANFTQLVYAQLETQEAFFPETFRPVVASMRTHNWLFHYRTLGGVQKSLGGLQRRATYMPDVQEAYRIFIGYYHILSQCWQELGDSLRKALQTQSL
jgi:acyl carrier protein phosphodiesterase